jgi:hypothetical protein
MSIPEGTVFGSLTVVRRELDVRQKPFLCRCECGNEKLVRRDHLLDGRVKSCGCKWRKGTHGMARTAEYDTWGAIKSRCHNPASKQFSDYGGRGIAVCDRWLDSFANFYADMGARPSAKHTIERRDNDRGYSPENCYWATRPEQLRNTRRNVRLEAFGRVKVLSDWAAEFGMSFSSLSYRLKVMGWPIERALTTPPDTITNRPSQRGIPKSALTRRPRTAGQLQPLAKT